jgi:hypothetical protein
VKKEISRLPSVVPPPIQYRIPPSALAILYSTPQESATPVVLISKVGLHATISSGKFSVIPLLELVPASALTGSSAITYIVAIRTDFLRNMVFSSVCSLVTEGFLCLLLGTILPRSANNVRHTFADFISTDCF